MQRNPKKRGFGGLMGLMGLMGLIGLTGLLWNSLE
jgi:hypothetical protein